MTRLFEDLPESEKPNQSFIAPPTSSAVQPTTVLNKSVRPKLGNAESIILITTTLFILIGYGNNFSQDVLIRLQLFLLWIWVIGCGWFLYKNCNLFGGELPKDEISKLTTTEKALIWLFSILSPSIVGIVILVLWRKNISKARRANMIVMIVFLIEIALGILVGIMQSKVSGG
jgi:hypothetical protein